MQSINLSRVLKLSVMAFALLFVTLSYSQESAAEYKAENEGWLVNIDEAYELSKETGKPILANFTGSDWCGWCKRLTASVFVHDEFKQWAKDNVVLLELDFPRRKSLPADIKAQNSKLQQAFGIRGYPTIHVFDLERTSAGEFAISSLGKTGYSKTVGEFTGGVDKMLERRSGS